VVIHITGALISHRIISSVAQKRSRQRSFLSQQKSSESTFWTAIAQKNETLSSDGIPAIPQIDRETGPLPPGAYRQRAIDDDARDASAPCLITVAIRPQSTSTDNTREDMWTEGVKNCQNLIDSGFNTFRMIDGDTKLETRRRRTIGRRSSLSIALEHIQQSAGTTDARHEAETIFYNKLRQNTPSSILRTCYFMTNIEIPFVLSEDFPGMEDEISPVSFGNGWVMRESISSALLRTKAEYLDSVVLEYRKNPYYLDVIDTLFELKREGLIRSISTKNFPPSLLRTCLECGFDISSNDVRGNLMNTNNLQVDTDVEVSRLISSPLGGGIFTDQFYRFQEWEQMSPSSKKRFNKLVDTCCKKQLKTEVDSLQMWIKYRSVVDVIKDLSFKYQVSVESITLRWLLQLNKDASISVGTSLGMDLREVQGGKAYSRQRDLRQVFTFSLEEDDMEKICQVSNFFSKKTGSSGTATEDEIDFTNTRLWI
jgi:diketogulonate reductase-like aldo/keto reductase